MPVNPQFQRLRCWSSDYRTSEPPSQATSCCGRAQRCWAAATQGSLRSAQLESGDNGCGAPLLALPTGRPRMGAAKRSLPRTKLSRPSLYSVLEYLHRASPSSAANGRGPWSITPATRQSTHSVTAARVGSPTPRTASPALPCGVGKDGRNHIPHLEKRESAKEDRDARA